MIEFKPLPGVAYKYDYDRIFCDIANGVLDPEATYRTLILNDLFFIVYFILGIPPANHPFIVAACQDVENGPASDTLDVWAREHYKSTILTTAEVIQKHMRNPELCIGLFSHTRPVAKGFLRAIMHTYENNETLKRAFPDVLWANPRSEAPKWSEDDGIFLKRKSTRREASLEAWGLLEGMPTSKHFDHRVYDDVETDDVVRNPATVKLLCDRYDLSQNLGVQNTGTHRVIGTYYSHEGLLTYIRDKRDIHGNLMYVTRVKPATSDGTPNGKPVLLASSRLDQLKANEYTFNCQQLLNPTPIGVRKLEANKFQEIDIIPKHLNKFMVIDPAGDNESGRGDPWAMGVFAVDPDKDDMGLSSVYLVDLVVEQMRVEEAIAEAVRMYLRNGMILAVGVEKVGISTVEIHVKEALAKRNVHISQDNKSLCLLKPAGRNKVKRIEGALTWPLFNNRLFVNKAIPERYRQHLYTEADKFPYWHDDVLDIWSYLYDILADPTFRNINRARWAAPAQRPQLGIV